MHLVCGIAHCRARAHNRSLTTASYADRSLVEQLGGPSEFVVENSDGSSGIQHKPAVNAVIDRGRNERRNNEGFNPLISVHDLCT